MSEVVLSHDTRYVGEEMDGKPMLQESPHEFYKDVLTEEEFTAISRVRPPYVAGLKKEAIDSPDAKHVASFIQQVRQNGLLTAEEEKLLGTVVQKGLMARKRLAESPGNDASYDDLKLKEAGKRAQEVMLNCNMLLAVGPARKWQKQYKNIEVMDFIQEGVFKGLSRAIEKFNPELGFKFSTYAMQWIDNAMQRYAQKRGHTIQMPLGLYVSGELKKYEKMRNDGVPEDAIVRSMGVSEATHERLQLAHAAQQYISLDTPKEDHEGNAMSKHEVIEDVRAQTSFQRVIDDSERRIQFGPAYETLLGIFDAPTLWAFVKHGEGAPLSDTDQARAQKLEKILQHPAVQGVMSVVIGEASVWSEAPCTQSPKKILKSREFYIKEMCIECPLFEQCEDLVKELRPTQGQWAGLTRTKKSYYPDGSPATVLGVANKTNSS